MSEYLNIVVLLGLIAALALGAWVLTAIDVAAKRAKARPQFGLLDAVCLFLLLQVSTGLVYWALPGEVPTAEQSLAPICLVSVVWGLWGLFWWAAVRELSQAGVRRGQDRAFVLPVVLPLIVFAFGYFIYLLGNVPSPNFPQRPSTASSILSGLGAGAVLLALVGCGLRVRSILKKAVARAEAERKEP